MKRVHVTCDGCGADNATRFATGTDFEYQTTLESFDFVRCRRCDHVYLNPRPDDAELPRIYPPTYYSYVQRENRGSGTGTVARLRLRYHSEQLRRAFGDVLAQRGRLRVLDVGCGDGRFLDVMRVAFGDTVETHGIDFDAKAVAFAAGNGHQTRVGTIDDADYPTASFDVVYISHVIEHLPSPREFLRSAHRVLAPGGVLHIETPNLDCAEARLFRRRYWGGYHFPRHWHLFTPESLSRLATESGFAVRDVRFTPSPVFLDWTFHHILWDRRPTRGFANLFPVTGIYRNTLHALALLAGFSLLERGLRLVSGGRGSGMVCRLERSA